MPNLNPSFSFSDEPEPPEIEGMERPPSFTMPEFRRNSNSSNNSGRIIEIAETFGMEFETEFLVSSDTGSNSTIKKYFRTTHDASIETDAYISQGGIILTKNSDEKALQYIGKSNFTLGTELVSVILKSSDENLLDLLKEFTDFLGEHGEPAQSYRAGIHYHISLPNPNLSILKAAMKLGLNLESIFFKLGGMGYDFRGIKNDSIYCRPISLFGPPCVQSNHGGYTQCFDANDVLNSNSTEDFWNRYGDLRRHSDRYNPVRYSWLNLYPMCPFSSEYKGTLEFRVFNKTLNPYFIFATIILCKKFTEYIVTNYKKLKFEDIGINSIFDDAPETRLKDIFYYTMRQFEMEDPIVYILEKILNSSETPKLPRNYVYSHLLTRRSLASYWSDGNYSPKTISEEIKKPGFVDIHTLRGE